MGRRRCALLFPRNGRVMQCPQCKTRLLAILPVDPRRKIMLMCSSCLTKWTVPDAARHSVLQHCAAHDVVRASAVHERIAQ